MIAVIDYGGGNLRSVANTLDALGSSYTLARDAAALHLATKIILPGVGHFGQLMSALSMRDALTARIRDGVPYLGICLGMQALFEESEEAPGVRGLGIFPGIVRRFPAGAKVPHMGWNQVTGGSWFYFAHSYYVPVVPQTVAVCDYELPFTAVLRQGSIRGVQFHPEKSGQAGLSVVRDFVESRC